MHHSDDFEVVANPTDVGSVTLQNVARTSDGTDRLAACSSANILTNATRRATFSQYVGAGTPAGADGRPEEHCKREGEQAGDDLGQIGLLSSEMAVIA